MRFVGGTEPDLMKKPFLRFDLTSSDGGTGHVAVIFHKQPELEKAIRDSIEQCSYSQLRGKSQLSSITEDDSLVYAEYLDHQGLKKRLSAPFLVGADGKTGYVRKQYLEPKGIVLERCEG